MDARLGFTTVNSSVHQPQPEPVVGRRGVPPPGGAHPNRDWGGKANAPGAVKPQHRRGG